MAVVPDIEIKVRLAEATVERLGVQDGDVLIVRLPEETPGEDVRERNEFIKSALEAFSTACDRAGLAKVGIVGLADDTIRFEIIRREDDTPIV